MPGAYRFQLVLVNTAALTPIQPTDSLAMTPVAQLPRAATLLAGLGILNVKYDLNRIRLILFDDLESLGDVAQRHLVRNQQVRV